MIVLVNGKDVSIVVKDVDLLEGRKNFYALFGTGYYDPRNHFRPCFDFPEGRRRLYDKFADEYNELLPEAESQFDKLKEMYERKMQPANPAPAPVTAPTAGGLGSQLEEIMIKVLAEQSVEKVLEVAKPALEKHITETFGVLPQIINVQTPTVTHQIVGAVHEKLETVLKLVNEDIPVFLTGAAGTGKNVICKQVAESLGLEFYFSNAVTQEYKLTGFIDANGHYHGTQFYEAFTKGGLFMLDEMDASIPEVLIILNAAIANRYFDFPTGRIEAHENFRIIAAGNTYGTGADMEYTGRFQLDAASLDRFAVVEINYSPAIEKAITNNNDDLIEFVHVFRKAINALGMKHVASYRSMDRICKMEKTFDNLYEVMQMCLLKGLALDDIKIITSKMEDDVKSSNKYYRAMLNA